MSPSPEPGFQSMPSPPKQTSKKGQDPMHDAAYIRRLKMANYGKWFIKPNKFTRKVAMINKELHDEKH